MNLNFRSVFSIFRRFNIFSVNYVLSVNHHFQKTIPVCYKDFLIGDSIISVDQLSYFLKILGCTFLMIVHE